MSLSHSPAVVTDGLQFYYDAANNKNVNSGTNLVLSPTNMTNATYWASGGGSPVITANATIAPDGTMTACSLINGGSISLWYQGFTTATIGTGQQFSSIYAKAFTSNIFTLNSYYAGDTEVNITFTLTGNGSTDTPTQSIIKFVGDGWYLCTIFTPVRVNGGGSFAYRIWPGGRAVSTTTGNYFWGPTLKNSFTDLVGSNTLTPSVLAYDSANNGAMSFNGSSSYIEGGIHHYQQLTLSSWFKATGAPSTNDGGGGLLIMNSPQLTGGVIQYQLSYSWLNENCMACIQGNGSNNVYTPTNSVLQNTINNVVATYDGATMKAYLNGVLSASLSVSTTLVYPTTGNMNVQIGRWGYTGFLRQFQGNIYATSIYNRSLSASEVTQNFNALRGRFGI